MHDHHEVASGIARLEGHLLAQTEISNARAEAEAFARRMPWLSTAQYEEVVRLYTEDRIALSRRVLERIVDRCHELKAEYTARYERLRRRLVHRCVAVVLASFALCLCTVLSTRIR
jgi:hypothetical protein